MLAPGPQIKVVERQIQPFALVGCPVSPQEHLHASASAGLAFHLVKSVCEILNKEPQHGWKHSPGKHLRSPLPSLR